LRYFHHRGNAFIEFKTNQNAQGVKIDNQHQHILGYLEKHKISKCIYWNENYLIHRYNNSHFFDNDNANFKDIGWVTPIMIMAEKANYCISDDYFEKINGHTPAGIRSEAS
jgi:hypothetical protein